MRHPVREQEVKLNVPPAARAAVERDMAKSGGRRIHLHAMYFDTPARELARAKVALRLRLEGEAWIQTLKMAGGDAISRIELNHARPGPILDLSVYAGTPAEAVLTKVKGELALRYETDVMRVIRKQRTRAGTVEIAFDLGAVHAGGFSLPICELEFELLSGQVDAIFSVARSWHERHGLVMDVRSKSERGDSLASLAADLDFKPLDDSDPRDTSNAAVTGRRKRAERIAAFWSPRSIQGVSLHADMTPTRALTVVTAECLDQIIRNAAYAAEVDTAGTAFVAGTPDHVHQLRVGVRRLRSAWKLFDGIAPLPSAELQAALRHHFGNFGTNRDREVMNATVLPKLLQAGMPELPEETFDEDDTSDALARDKAFQGVLLSLLEWSVVPHPPGALPAATATAAASADLARADTVAASGATLLSSSEGGGLPAAVDGATSDPSAGDDAATLASESGAGTGLRTPADDLPGTDATALRVEPVAPGARLVPTIIPLGAPSEHPRLDTQLLQRVLTWHRQIVKRGKRFASLDIERKHALRKRVKLLRYGLGFSESLLSGSRLRAYRKHLAKVQDLLGEFNDMAVAHDAYLARTQQTRQAWFAVGWLSAEQQRVVLRAQDAFESLGAAPEFWKG